MRITSKFLAISAMAFFTSICHAQELTKQEKGYFNVTELGLYYGNNSLQIDNASGGYNSYNDGAYALSLRTINGVFITDKVSLGIGVGLENYTLTESNTNSNLFQLFGDARYYFKNEASTFFAYGQLGPSLAISDRFEKGTMYNLGIGYKFKVSDKTAMNGSFGFIDQYIKTNPNLRQNRYYGIALKVGVMF